MNVKFSDRIKVKDLLTRFDPADRLDFPRKVSRFIVAWDLVDAYSGNPLPLPGIDSDGAWFDELTPSEQAEMYRQWEGFRAELWSNPPPLRDGNSPATP